MQDVYLQDEDVPDLFRQCELEEEPEQETNNANSNENPAHAKIVPKPHLQVKVVSRTIGASDQPLRRSGPAADGLVGYTLCVSHGVPVVFDVREINVFKKD